MQKATEEKVAREVFIIIKTKPYRHFLKLFLKDRDGKTDQRLIPFTTEHKVTEKERVTGARRKHAEYSSSNRRIIEALYRDTGYGIVFQIGRASCRERV